MKKLSIALSITGLSQKCSLKFQIQVYFQLFYDEIFVSYIFNLEYNFETFEDEDRNKINQVNKKGKIMMIYSEQ